MKKISIAIGLLAILFILPKAMAAITIPFEKPRAIRFGKASWYSHKSPGIKYRTANNEIFDEGAMTCAIWGVGFDRKIRVTNVANGKAVIVRVNDRGPSKRYVQRGRVIDLTKAAFEKLNISRQGLIEVKLEFL